MTATIPPVHAPALPPRRRLLGGPPTVSAATRAELRDLGGVAVFALRLFLLIAPTGMFLGLWNLEAAQTYQPFFYTLPAFGALVIAPRRFMLRIPISLSLFLLLGWIALSYTWSVDPTQTQYSIRQTASMSIAMLITVGLLPVEETFRWFLRGIKLLLLLSLAATIFDSTTRVSIEFGSVLSAWEAWFPSKNNLGRFVVLAVSCVLWLDRNVVSKIFWCGLAMVLLVGANSATAVAALFFMALVVFWIRRYQRLGDDLTGVFAVVSVFVAIIVALGAFASVALIVDALGRDLTFTGRTDIWNGVIPFIQDRPWRGYGYEALWTLNSPESRAVARAVGFPPAHAHNGVLNVMAAVGIPGLLFFFGLFVSTLVTSLRHLRRSAFAAWSFTFVMLQLVFGSVEATYITDWLPVMVLARMSMAKLGRQQRALDEQDTALAEAIRPTLSIDLDADPTGFEPVGVVKR